MTLFHSMYLTQNLKKPLAKRWLGFSAVLLALILGLNQPLKAAQSRLERAESLIESKQYQQALPLFTALSTDKSFNTQGLFGLARVAFYQRQLDDAQEYIEAVLQAVPDNPDYLFIAARIAAAQAQQASMFSKLGYARDAKQYFSQALKVDSQHKPSLIGLIKFHQQAPVMAGGDKDAIPSLLKKLWVVDQRAAFTIQAPQLLNNKQVEKAKVLYLQALNSSSETDLGQFKFDFAMLLAGQGDYEYALKELLSINLSTPEKRQDFASMRLYQIGKLAAESKSNLEQGLDSMIQYDALPAENKTIPQDWVEFRLAQLKLLKTQSIEARKSLNALKEKTSDDNLKNKIQFILGSE
ncbi:tetratricopeptide repeat protein [Aliikangiella sp. IMCC44653]